MNTNILKRKTLWFSVLFLSLFACEKPKGELDESVLPAGDILSFKASSGLPFMWDVQKADSIATQNLSVSLLGSYNDIETGKSEYGTAFQLRLSTSGATFDKPNVTIDSVILSLVVSDIYGAEDFQHQLSVKELSESLSSDSVYYSNHNFLTEAEELVLDENTPYTYSIESVVVEGDTQSAQIRVPLKTSVGEKLIVNSTDADLLNNDAFLTYFKGLEISTTNEPGLNDGNVGLINLLSIYSKLSVYYSVATEADTNFTHEFLINGNSIRATSIAHDFTGANVAPELDEQEAATEYAYIKTGGGLFSTFNITSLDTLKSFSPIGIATAEVFFPVKQDANFEKFPPSEKLILVEVNEDGTFRVLTDQLEGDDYFGGSYDAEKGGYTFRIARFVQQYMTRTDDFKGFALIPAFGGVRANRTLLLKNEEGGLSPELIVYFAEL